jgi:hypothetical protein
VQWQLACVEPVQLVTVKWGEPAAVVHMPKAPTIAPHDGTIASFHEIVQSKSGQHRPDNVDFYIRIVSVTGAVIVV